MDRVALDELVAWTYDDRGRLNGFDGLVAEHRLGWLGRFFLPNLGRGFAEPGDLLKVERDPFFESQILGVANLTRRHVEMADPLRGALCAALMVALPLPSVMRGRWWTLIVSSLVAAIYLFFFIRSRTVLRRAVTEEEATERLYRWSGVRGQLVPPPPLFTIREAPEPDWVALLDRAYAGDLEDHETVEIGTLPVPDGKLLACEPFLIHDPRAYTISVPPGTYPAFISIAAAPDSADQRIAYAWVRLRDGIPARWEPARTRGGEEVSVGVDSGIAGFVSASSAKALIEAHRGSDGDYISPLSDTVVEAMDKVWRDTRGWAMVGAPGAARLAAFSSGFGDGTYPVYRAVDARGRRLAVAMHFFVDW